VAEGAALPELVIPVTRTLIVSAAIASRDYQDVHHDAELAKKRGSPDIFMNILTSNGLVSRFVTDWTGPTGLVRGISIRLGAPNYPDDQMTMTGSVTALLGPEPSDGPPTRGAVEVTVRGANSLGDHVTGKVTVSLPLGGAA
jgi:hypothetical protein